MVLYARLFGEDDKDDKDFQPYMDAFDGIIMRIWILRRMTWLVPGFASTVMKRSELLGDRR